LIHGKEQKLNIIGREEIIPKYKSTSPPYYPKEYEDKSLRKEFKILNLTFIMWLSKKPQLKALECPEELNRYF
jgi:hypothetical protein